MNYLYHPKVQLCVSAICRGDVIAYPTEAVWGLGCDPFNRHAVHRILALKQRAVEKGLILVAASMHQLDGLLEGLTATELNQLEKSWPGHVTWLLPHRNRIPAEITGVHKTVAVRVSAHPVVKALCEGFGGPIVSTSANPQALPPARTGTDVRRYFGNTELVIAPGQVGRHAMPSEIRDLSCNILRA